MSSVAFLGPKGTFTHQAARSFAEPEDDLEPFSRAIDVVQAVETNNVDAGVIAFENSLEGVVTSSLDELLLATQECLIAGEKVLPVSFDLFAASEGSKELVGVSSHPFALAQCSDFINSNDLETRETTSTAEACRNVAEGAEPGWAAIGPAIAGDIYGLATISTALENSAGPETRFVLLRTSCPPASGRDRSAFSLRPRRDEPGSLVRYLQDFAARGINLTAIKSRPTHGQLGEYLFFIECEGHISDPLLRAAVASLLQLPGEVRFLGSFPVDPTRPLPSVPDSSMGADDAYAAMIARIDNG